MLSYRHSFHAGNHADVLKHTVQSLIIESLKEKEKPFLYLDTHAGAGRYQLSGEHAERTGEYLEGIARIWQQDDLPAELEPYISVVEHFNRNGQLCYYPGSPLIARQLLRASTGIFRWLPGSTNVAKDRPICKPIRSPAVRTAAKASCIVNPTATPTPPGSTVSRLIKT